MTMNPESFKVDEPVTIGANGAALVVERELVEGLLFGTGTLSMGFDLTPDTAGQSGEILRLGTSFIVQVDRTGELVVRAEDAAGDLVRLATKGAGLDGDGAHAIGIGLENGVLSATVDGKLVGQVAMPSPVTVNGWAGHDFTIGNPWSNANYTGTLSGFDLTTEPLALPACSEAEEVTRDPHLVAEAGMDFRFGETVQIDAEGSAQTIARSRVEDLIVDAETFALGFEITPDASGQSGEVMRLGTSFIVHVDKDGELVVRAEVESGDRLRLETDGAFMDQAGTKDVRIGLTDGEMYVLVDGAEVGGMAMPSPITVNGWDGHDFSIGNPWSNGNYEGTLGNLRMGEGDLSPAPDNGDDGTGSDADDGMAGDVAPETGSGEGAGPGAENPPETGGGEDSDTETDGPSEPSGDGDDAITVSDMEELQTALAEAEAGDTILVASGQYGALSVRGFNAGDADGVTIASEDPEDRASFSGLDLRGVGGLTFRDMDFTYSFDPADPIYDRPFSISGGRDITFDGAVFQGDRAVGLGGGDDGFGWAVGLSVRGSKDITLEDSEFVDFWKGAVFTESHDLVVRGTEMHGIRSDGLNFARVRDVLIEENNLHNFDRAWDSLDHADMIQFWTRGAEAPSTGITIRGNHLDIGEGGFTQSIFMRNDMVDRGLAGEEMFYRDVTIEDNVIVNGHRHGIAVGETAGLVIRDNTVLHGSGNAAGDAVGEIDIPRISVAHVSTDVEVSGNVTSEIAGWGGQSDWVLADNVLVQNSDPDAPGYYGDVFLSSTLGVQDGQHALIARPGGEVDLAGAGAPATGADPEGLAAAFQVVTPDGETATRIYDARYTTAADGDQLEDAVFTWTFSDGSTVEGAIVQRAYSGGTDETVSLSVVLPDGTVSEADHALSISDPTLLRYEAGGDIVADDGTVFDISKLVTAEGLDLDETGKSVDIEKEHIAEIAGADEFEFDFALEAKGPESDGEVFRYGTSLVVSVTDDGELEVKARTEDGRVTLRTSDADLDDMASHDIELSLLDDELSLLVDGTEMASGSAGGGLLESGNHGLYFGNPWGSDNFEGMLTSFEVTRDASDFAEETMSQALTSAEADGLLGF